MVSGVDQVGREDLGVAALARVQVEHEVDRARARAARRRRVARRSARPRSWPPRSKSRIPSSGPEVEVRPCGLKSKRGGSPTRATSTLALASAPRGTLASGTLGRTRSAWRMASSTSARRVSRPLISSETPFISVFRSAASSRARPRRAISSPQTLWRWRSCSTFWRSARRSPSRAQGSPRERSSAPPRSASICSTAARFSTTHLRSSMFSQGGHSRAPRWAFATPPETPLARRRRCAAPPCSAVGTAPDLQSPARALRSVSVTHRPAC